MKNVPDSGKQIVIRPANVADVEQITALCQQLGYPTSTAAVKQRLDWLQQDERHAIYVAQSLDDGQIVGWVHVYTCQLLLKDLQAEIGGLIVAEGDRHHGIGQRLMQSAELWATAQGCKDVLIHSNSVRQTAHNFYEKIGYSQIKTSLMFQKFL